MAKKRGAVRVTVHGTADMKQITAARLELDKLEAAARRNQTPLTRMQRGVAGVTSAVREMGPALLVAGAAIGAGAWRLAQMGEAGLQAEARIHSIAKSMGLFGYETKEVADRLIALADVQARATGVDDDVIQATQAKLLTFKELAKTADEVGGAFDRTTLAALDLAAAGFGDATGNAKQLGRALQDPVRGLTALGRAGVTFTDQEREKIRTLAESGRMLEAQNLLLEAIETQVGGTAEATATATSRMRAAWGQIAEDIGIKLVPVLETVADEMSKIAASPGMGHELPPLGILEVREYRANVKETEREVDILTSRLKGMRGAATTLSPAIRDNATTADDSADAYDDLTRAMDGTMVMSDELSGKLRTLTEAGLDKTDAAIRVREAEARVAEALKESGRGSDVYASAVVNLERAKLRSGDATADLRILEEKLGGTQEELAKKDAYLKHLEEIRVRMVRIGDAAQTAGRRALALSVPGDRATGGALRLGAGAVVSSPVFAMVGERHHREYVITTEPAYRSRSLALIESLSRDLGVKPSGATSYINIAVDARGASDPVATERAVIRAVETLLDREVSSGRLQASMMGA